MRTRNNTEQEKEQEEIKQKDKKKQMGRNIGRRPMRKDFFFINRQNGNVNKSEDVSVKSNKIKIKNLDKL